MVKYFPNVDFVIYIWFIKFSFLFPVATLRCSRCFCVFRSDERDKYDSEMFRKQIISTKKIAPLKIT